MKKPKWLEKEALYKIMFESEHPVGRIFDLTLITAISLSIIISFIETIPRWHIPSSWCWRYWSISSPSSLPSSILPVSTARPVLAIMC